MSARYVARAVMRGAAAFKRWMYRDGWPNAFMRRVNRFDVLMYGSRLLSPRHAAVLKVMGRRSGRLTSLPVVVTEHRGAEFLVSMLGPEANWVRNVQAAGGKAVLCRHGRETPVALKEVPPEQRAEILRRYLAVAPGARPHIPVNRHAPLPEFEKITHQYPVFRIAGPDTPLLQL